MNTKPFMTTGEAAELLQVTGRTVTRWADDGRLPCSRTFGGHRRYLLADVLKAARKLGIPIDDPERAA